MRNLIGALLGVLVCVNVAEAQQSPLRGLQPLSFPRSSLPIGAKWLQGSGPNGSGVDDANLEQSQGLGNVQISNTMKRALNFSLGTFLGLSGDRARSLDAKYTNLSVDRVKDVAKVPGLQAGQRILYEAVRAERIEIKAASGTNAALKAAAEAKGIPVSLAMSSGNNSVLTIDGSKLYIAYKVMEIGPATRSVVRGSLSNYSTAFETRVGPYRVSRAGFDNANFCAPSFAPQSTKFTVVNEDQPDITGAFSTREISVMARAPSQEFQLDATQTNNRIFARRLRINYYPTGRWDKVLGHNACMIEYPEHLNFVELTTSQFDLRILNDPRGL